MRFLLLIFTIISCNLQFSYAQEKSLIEYEIYLNKIIKNGRYYISSEEALIKNSPNYVKNEKAEFFFIINYISDGIYQGILQSDFGKLVYVNEKYLSNDKNSKNAREYIKTHKNENISSRIGKARFAIISAELKHKN
ncbi:hypothetical protein [Chishuiella sp.]|uniref:hypothetical protein n=1 Tax=Chishuiella sp. TaxID=1969467 RepID=UPI0028A62AC5|nr:hypothetical protein [Chishuiella sp.]